MSAFWRAVRSSCRGSPCWSLAACSFPPRTSPTPGPTPAWPATPGASTRHRLTLWCGVSGKACQMHAGKYPKGRTGKVLFLIFSFVPLSQSSLRALSSYPDYHAAAGPERHQRNQSLHDLRGHTRPQRHHQVRTRIWERAVRMLANISRLRKSLF